MNQSALARVLLFVAFLSTVLYAGGAMAHAFAFINKMAMPRESYLIAQRIYDGWWQFAYVLLAQVASLVALGVVVRKEHSLHAPLTVALAAIVAGQAAFWLYTQPANVATASWTQLPENWEELRRQWEYSHLADAVLQIIALCALFWAALVLPCSPRLKPSGDRSPDPKPIPG